MQYLKDIIQDFKSANGTGKLSIISDLVQIVTVFTGIVFAPRIISLIFNIKLDTYFGLVLATMATIVVLILFALTVLSVNSVLRLIVKPNNKFWFLYAVLIQVITWGLGLAYIPALISFFYQMVVW